MTLELKNPALLLRCAPELGGRIHTLIDHRTGRDWLWKQNLPEPLFAPADPTDFTTACFAGLDECLPTVAACHTPEGLSLPDHGSLWARRWSVRSQRPDSFELEATCPQTGWSLLRRVQIQQSLIRFDYTLRNISPAAQAALWAMHPLFTWLPGDRLTLPTAINHLQATASQPPSASTRLDWPAPTPGVALAQFSLADNQRGYLKAFSPPLDPADTWALVENPTRQDRLMVRWDADAAPHLGLWLTRGGYRQWHHFALEPTFAPCDSLQEALAQGHGPRLTLAPGQTKRWWSSWDLSPE